MEADEETKGNAMRMMKGKIYKNDKLRKMTFTQDADAMLKSLPPEVEGFHAFGEYVHIKFIHRVKGKTIWYKPFWTFVSTVTPREK